MPACLFLPPHSRWNSRIASTLQPPSAAGPFCAHIPLPEKSLSNIHTFPGTPVSAPSRDRCAVERRLTGWLTGSFTFLSCACPHVHAAVTVPFVAGAVLIASYQRRGRGTRKPSPAAEVCLLANLLGGLDWFFSRPEYDVRVPYTLASAVDRLFYYIFERPACPILLSRLVLVGPWLSV